jgi:hypothetical protein
MMKTNFKTMSVGAAVAVAGMALQANAAIITVDAITTFQNSGGNITGTFDASGFDKLVVVVTGEHGFPNNENGDTNGVTYNGTSLVQAVNRNPIVVNPDPKEVDQTYNDIWYLDNPGGTATSEIFADVSTRGSMTVFGLSNTLPGVAATVISDRQSRAVDLTTSGPDSLVIASFGMGGDGNTADVNNVTVDSPLTFASAQENGSTWDGHVTGYAQVPTAGTGTYSFSGGNISGSHVIAAEFEAVPEPSALALLGLGGLAFLRRRR